MKAFVKTLFGDSRNVAAVVVVLAVGAGLALAGQPRAAWLAAPVLTLAAAFWLAQR